MDKKFYITTPIYYVNDKPHIGHAYTTLVADVISRYNKNKLKDKNVFFLTGTDEHGSKVSQSAERFGKNTKEFCDNISDLFKHVWNSLNIEYNHFIRTTDDYHEQGVKEFLISLKEKGALYESYYTGLYCTGCESFLTKKQLDENGNCPHHQRPPEQVKEKNWFFDLKKYLPKIIKAIESEKIKIEPEVRKQEVFGMFKQGMENFSVSRPNVKWGIPLPWDKTQTIYVWIDALLNYWTGIFKNPNKKLDDFWPPTIQLMAKDIIKFHCIYWPAMLLAYFDGDESMLPNKIFAHGFFTVNGQKMSKTLGNVIDPANLVNKYGTDGARYLILSQFPFGQDGDIEENKFTEKYNADLANGIGNTLSRVTTLSLKKILNWNDFWKKVKEHYETESKNKEYYNLMDNLKLFESIKFINYEIKKIDEFLAKEKPWSLDQSKSQDKIINILSRSCAILLNMSDYIYPFIPLSSKSIKKSIDIELNRIISGESLFPRK